MDHNERFYAKLAEYYASCPRQKPPTSEELQAMMEELKGGNYSKHPEWRLPGGNERWHSEGKAHYIKKNRNRNKI